MNRPYAFVQDIYPVKMIRHNHELVYLAAAIKRGKFVPKGLNHTSDIIQLHFTIDDISEQTLAILHANRDEIGARPAVVIMAQAD